MYLLHIAWLVATLSMTGCLLDLGGDERPGPGGGSGGGGDGGGGGGGNPPVERGPQTMSDVHVDQRGEQVWIIHSAVANIHASPRVTTAHLGVYVPAEDAFHEVLDTTGTHGKKILFPAEDRMLLVTGRGTREDVYVTIDTVARRPVRQRTYPGNRTAFQMSPTGRAVLSTNAGALHIVDSESLVDQAVRDTANIKTAVWANVDDVVYLLRPTQTSPSETIATQLYRLDLRSVDLSGQLPPPTLVTTLSGNATLIVVSPDDRFAAALVLQDVGTPHVAMIDLVTAATRTLESASRPTFTRDGRVTIWGGTPDAGHELRLVDPATGAATPPVASTLRFPAGIPLVRHDLVIATSFLLESAPSFLFRITDGAQTPMTSGINPSSQFEHPVRSELWIWEEYFDQLRRLDLATGVVTAVIDGVDSVDYRADTDDIVVNTFEHSVFRLSMATGTVVGRPLVLADPNDVAAPHKLGPD